MDTVWFDALLRSVTTVTSRRGVLAGLASGFLATGLRSQSHEEALGKGRNRNQNKKRRKRKKNTRPDPESPPLPSPPSGPVARVDASCPGSTDVALGGVENERFAQTFTALASGSLVRVDLLIIKDEGSAGDYILHLGSVSAFGVPTNQVLAVTSVANVSVPAGVSTISFRFASPATVQAGTQYALVLIRPGSDPLVWNGHRGDTCGGQAFVSPNQTAPFAASDLDIDLIFTTFVSS